MVPAITLSQALKDPALFGNVFASPSFWPWRCVAKLIDGLPLTEPREVELFEQCTGRSYGKHNARRAVRRFIILAGRRAGKDRFLSAVGCWRAALCTNWRKHISAGEQAVVILLGADKKQASILRRYCQGLLATPLLAREVVRTTGEVTEFRNGSSLEIATNDARLVRGRSAIAVLGSECAHWKTDEHAASSDEEVVGAALPSMAMCPDDGLLLLGSSVYRKRGYMFRKWRELHGNDEAEDVCWFAPSNVMNPKLPQHVIEKALAEDSAKARAEYLNTWREDLSDFIPIDVIENATDFGVYQRPPLPGVRYFAHADAAGGTGTDSFALVIAHREGDKVIIDVVLERKPRFVPAEVVAEFAKVLRTYQITEVTGDSYAIGFHSREWLSNSVAFVSSRGTTSENYLTLLPLLLAGRVRLLDNARGRSQLGALERQVGAADRESVRHPQHANAHDDIAAAIAGVVAAARPGMQREVSFAPPFVASNGPRLVPGGTPPAPAAVAGGALSPVTHTPGGVPGSWHWHVGSRPEAAGCAV
jgi:hypothetical protein